MAVIGLTMFLIGGMWTLGLWIRKAVELFKWGLMDCSSRSVEDGGAEGDVNCGAQLKRFQRRRMLVCGLETSLVIFQ